MYRTYTGGIWEISDNIKKRFVRSLIFDTAECSRQDRERWHFYFKHQKSTIKDVIMGGKGDNGK